MCAGSILAAGREIFVSDLASKVCDPVVRTGAYPVRRVACSSVVEDAR